MCSFVLCCTILFCIVLCSAVLYYVVLCFALLEFSEVKEIKPRATLFNASRKEKELKQMQKLETCLDLRNFPLKSCNDFIKIIVQELCIQPLAHFSKVRENLCCCEISFLVANDVKNQRHS